MKEKISAHLNIIINSRDRRRMASDVRFNIGTLSVTLTKDILVENFTGEKLI